MIRQVLELCKLKATKGEVKKSGKEKGKREDVKIHPLLQETESFDKDGEKGVVARRFGTQRVFENRVGKQVIDGVDFMATEVQREMVKRKREKYHVFSLSSKLQKKNQLC